MPPRFDAEHRTLDLSVADLLDAPLSRSLGFSSRGGFERLWLGQAIHGRYQEAALAGDATYRREVVLFHSFDHRGWRVTVQGRADGLRREPDGALVVEEIKSVRRGAVLPPAVRESYQRQALLYAWMLAQSESTPVRAELVLIPIGSDEVEREALELEIHLLDAVVRRRVNALLFAWEEDRLRESERREAAERLAFPYRELRPGQELILAAVETAVANREHLLLQAATGIGKTVATLYPALKYALAHGKRLFVLTAKNTQQEMATQVLRLLNQEGAFHSLRLRAKARMCANDQILCHEEYCRFAKDYGLKLIGSGVLDRLRERHTSIEPDDVFAAAQAAEVCPFEVSLELSNRVEVTVCDYNYVFDPYVSLSGFGPEGDLSDIVLVIDEVHNLVDRGRGYYSPELSSHQARLAAESAAHRREPIFLRIETVCLQIAALIDRTVADALEDGPASDRAVEWSLPEETLWRLRPALDETFVDYLEFQRETKSFQPDDRFVDLYFGFLRFLNALAVSDHAFSHLAELAGGDRRLRIFCKDPSRFLGDVLRRTHAAVGLSATLSPPEFYTHLLGFEAGRTAFVEIPNPFPAENRRVVIDSTVSTAYKERPFQYDRIAERLTEFAESVSGNCLALFPSYAFLSEVAGRLRLRSKRILVQRRTDDEKEREILLQSLRTAIFGDILLVAVAGGVFAEGVDYPGDMLKAVAVVGPCLPGVSLETELLKRYYEERFEKGFEYAFVVPGMTRVVQAAGRLIRSPRDTGVIALFDRRFLHAPYRDYLPADWLPEEGAGALVGHPAEEAEDFFKALSLRA